MNLDSKYYLFTLMLMFTNIDSKVTY